MQRFRGEILKSSPEASESESCKPSQSQTKDAAFPPTPSQINRMPDLKHESCSSDLSKSSILAWKVAQLFLVTFFFKSWGLSIEAPVSIHDSLEMVIKDLHALLKISNHLVEIKNLLEASYKTSKCQIFFFLWMRI